MEGDAGIGKNHPIPLREKDQRQKQEVAGVMSKVECQDLCRAGSATSLRPTLIFPLTHNGKFHTLFSTVRIERLTLQQPGYACLSASVDLWSYIMPVARSWFVFCHVT